MSDMKMNGASVKDVSADQAQSWMKREEKE